MAISNQDEETALFIAAYTEARRLFVAGDDSSTPLAKYDQIELRQSIPFQWAAYDQMFKEHSREIANELNDIRHNNAMLAAWSEVLKQYDEQDSWSLRNEFVDNIATACLSAPHVLEGRFIFSISHLSHQANLITNGSWKETELPIDRNINRKVMRKVAAHWPEFSALNDSLQRLCSAEYQLKTRGFRDKHHHRFPPRFEIGQTEVITRTLQADGRASYGFGGLDPISIDVMVPLVIKQRVCAMECFDSYLALVRAQLKAIYATAAPLN